MYLMTMPNYAGMLYQCVYVRVCLSYETVKMYDIVERILVSQMLTCSVYLHIQAYCSMYIYISTVLYVLYLYVLDIVIACSIVHKQ
jgi:hypothetical protein